MIPVVDLVGIGLVALCGRSGKRHGPAREIYRLIRVTTALIAGCGLYSLTRTFLSNLLPAASGLTGFLVYFGGTFFLVRFIKTALLQKLNQHFQGASAEKAGWIAGSLRGGVLLLSLVTLAHVAPIFPWKESITQNSWIGRIPDWFLPDSETPAQEESEIK